MIDIEERGIVTIVSLRHGKANAMDVEVLRELGATIERLADTPGAIVLTGQGSIFSAGVDLKRVVKEDAAYALELVQAVSRTLSAMIQVSRPVVAAINGHAIAGGCILAGACDYRLMAGGRGRIGVPELLVGVPFPAIAFEILRSTVVPHRLQEAVYLGRTYLPEQAQEVGLVDEVVEPEALVDRAAEVASGLARIPLRSFAAAKRQLRQPLQDRLARHGERTDAEVAEVWQSEEVRRAIEAYVADVLR